MSSNLLRRGSGLGALAVVLLVGGCGTGSSLDGQPGVTAPPSASSTTTPSTLPEELTAQEQLRVNPPPPERLTATRRGATVVLAWTPPPEVTVPHGYSDRVVEYHVYRSADGGAEVLVGTSSSLTFTDTAPPAGTLRYAVSSVREHGVEGGRTDAVTAPAAS